MGPVGRRASSDWHPDGDVRVTRGGRAVKEHVREALLAAVAIVAAASVVYGVAAIYVPAAWIVGGLLLAFLGALFLVESS